MARTGRSETVFFRYEGDERRDIYLRINPQAVRGQQGRKGAVVDTLGGYFRESVWADDPQYSGKTLSDLTVEATTGIRYRKELQEIKWIWDHQGDRRSNGKPVDIYFFDLIKDVPFQGIERAAERIYLIDIQNFAFDDTVQAIGEIRFTLRCKILRDLLGELDATPPANAATLPRLTPFDPTQLQDTNFAGSGLSVTRVNL